MKTLKLAATTLAITIAIGAGMTTTHYVNAASAADTTEQQDASSQNGSGKRGAFNGEKQGAVSHGQRGNGWLASDEIAGVLGLTADELKTALQGDKTLATIAAEQNVDVDTVVDAIVKAKTAKLDEQLSEGKLTQEEYDKRVADSSEQAQKMVNGEWKGKPGGGKGASGHHGGLKGIGSSEEVAEVLGLTTDELKTEVQSGKTLAAIAAERNVDVQSVVAAIVESKTAKYNEQLSEGKLTQEQYDEKIAGLNEKAETLVNSELKGKESNRGSRDEAGKGRPGSKRGGSEAAESVESAEGTAGDASTESSAT
ncbi:hypothetical protein ACX93W_26115 [Paenibacillus sp. CAU 1782]